MPIKSQYEKRIEAYIDINPDSKVNQVVRLEIEGRVRDIPVYRLPTKLLVFNIENGRFAADHYSLQKELRRRLDTRKPSDAKKVSEILLEKFPEETRRFREDLKRIGQSDPGVITSAGVVINGNRRMAILGELHKETSQERYLFLEVAILPHGLSDLEIYKIEAQLQYRRDYELGYGPVNELLEYRKLHEKGMSIKAIAALLSRKEKYIEEHLAQLNLLDAYSKYAWQKIDYRNLEKKNITEHITNVESNLRKFKNEGRRATEIKKLLEIQFAYIKAGCSHLDIRKLGKFASVDDIERSYTRSLSKLKEGDISEESFKEMINDVNERGSIIKKDNKPVELVIQILEQVKGYQDEQFKISPEIKKYFVEISRIIAKLLKK